MPTRSRNIKECMTIFLHEVLVENYLQLKNYKNRTYRLYAKGYILIELKNDNTFYNTKILSISNQQPSQISSRSSSTHFGAKINNTGFVDKKNTVHKKTVVQPEPRHKFRIISWGQTNNTGILKTMQYIEIHKPIILHSRYICPQ
jgi:hypothetical protein